MIRKQAAFLVMFVAVAVALVLSGVPRSAHAGTNPTIGGVSPSSGSVLGGTQITITGSDFLPGAAVYIGGAAATGVVVASSTQITATTPRGITGSANVLIINSDGGARTLNSGFFYTEASSALSISGLSAASGPIRGGTPLIITGTGFSGTVVTFGGAPATGVQVLGPSSISLRTPPGVAGAVTVAVRNGDGTTASLPNAFTYAGGGLEVTGVTPLGGLVAGGAAMRIFGYGFAAGSAVLVGGTPATNVVVVNSTLITATSPAGVVGTVPVVVTSGGVSASIPNAFSYRATAAGSGLAVASIAPATGSAVGGTSVTISGAGFSGGAVVYFGGVPASDASSPGPSTITVRTPPNVAGAVPVTVVNSDGSSVTLNNGFTYEGNSGFTLSSVSPASGAASGGTVLLLSGAGFVSGAMVTVGGVNASNVWVVGDSQVYATTPAGASGPATVTVTNPGGLSASLASSFTYGAGGTTPPPASTPTVPPSSGTSIGFPLPVRGFGLVVFGGGSNAALVSASTCTSSSLAFWSTNAGGDFDVYVPGASIGAVNEAWNARFANGIPASTPLIGRCQS